MAKYNPEIHAIMHLDEKQADKYVDKMAKEQSEKESLKDIRGLRAKEKLFRDRSYADLDKSTTKKYEEMEKSKHLINKIPDRGYKEHR